ncbi:hypothetical protein BHE74_00051151 [Ensete ventricosum]|nr:hypothetical protein BHE74_00051151 [Ensete ventricosum]
MADIDQCWSDVGSRPGSVVSCEGEVVATAAKSNSDGYGWKRKMKKLREVAAVGSAAAGKSSRSRGKEEGSDDIGVAKEGATKVTATTKDNVATWAISDRWGGDGGGNAIAI